MTRFHASKEELIKQLMSTHPVHFSAFDLLYLNGESLISKPLEERLEKLKESIPGQGYISICPTYEDGEKLFSRVKELGLEGIVSKNLHKPYYLDARPKGVFMKIKNYQYATVTIAGIRKKEFGWLIQKDGGNMGVLEFVPPTERKAFFKISNQLITSESKDFIYIKPVIQCEVKYQCLSKKGYMRSASFERFVL